MGQYQLLESDGKPIKAWIRGVTIEDQALQQLRNISLLSFIHQWLAVMPDVHKGQGSTIGSVIPTLRAIIPAAVGVDIGCGMMALLTSLMAHDLPDNLLALRLAIELAVPHGRTDDGGPNDVGAWNISALPDAQVQAWKQLLPGYQRIVAKHPKVGRCNNVNHLGTLGTGNHFIEVCLDESNRVWLMLHSGSRGVGNRIGSYFTELAKQDMHRLSINLPDKDLAYLREGTEYFNDYVEAVSWAQEYAIINRVLMMQTVIRAVQSVPGIPPFTANVEAINCHHNYVALEHHYGEDVYVTRKGAIRAGRGDMGIIPGSMGDRSFIVRGKGNPESFNSCSHGAGRIMSRTDALKTFTVADHVAATQGIECLKDEGVLDETPKSYKPIEAVMAAQSDLVEIQHTLNQVVCVKGKSEKRGWKKKKEGGNR